MTACYRDDCEAPARRLVTDAAVCEAGHQTTHWTRVDPSDLAGETDG